MNEKNLFVSLRRHKTWASLNWTSICTTRMQLSFRYHPSCSQASLSSSSSNVELSRELRLKAIHFLLLSTWSQIVSFSRLSLSPSLFQSGSTWFGSFILLYARRLNEIDSWRLSSKLVRHLILAPRSPNKATRSATSFWGDQTRIQLSLASWLTFRSID